MPQPKRDDYEKKIAYLTSGYYIDHPGWRKPSAHSNGLVVSFSSMRCYRAAKNVFLQIDSEAIHLAHPCGRYRDMNRYYFTVTEAFAQRVKQATIDELKKWRSDIDQAFLELHERELQNIKAWQEKQSLVLLGTIEREDFYQLMSQVDSDLARFQSAADKAMRVTLITPITSAVNKLIVYQKDWQERAAERDVLFRQFDAVSKLLVSLVKCKSEVVTVEQRRRELTPYVDDLVKVGEFYDQYPAGIYRARVLSSELHRISNALHTYKQLLTKREAVPSPVTTDGGELPAIQSLGLSDSEADDDVLEREGGPSSSLAM